jgi:hypothetical protein
MEKVANYRRILAQVIEEQSRHGSTMPGVEVFHICDDEHQQYQLLYLGWQADQRVFAPVIHLRIRDGKIWVEQDDTEEGIATTLLARGVPRDDIVLAFYSPSQRTYTEFAVA